MAEKRRTPQETKDVGIQRLKDSFEKQNGRICPAEKTREFEKLYNEKLLPRVYEDRK